MNESARSLRQLIRSLVVALLTSTIAIVLAERGLLDPLQSMLYMLFGIVCFYELAVLIRKSEPWFKKFGRGLVVWLFMAAVSILYYGILSFVFGTTEVGQYAFTFLITSFIYEINVYLGSGLVVKRPTLSVVMTIIGGVLLFIVES